MTKKEMAEKIRKAVNLLPEIEEVLDQTRICAERAHNFALGHRIAALLAKLKGGNT